MIESDSPLTQLPTDPESERISQVPALVYPYLAGVKGGLAGGVGMIVVGLTYGMLTSHGIWYPVNLIAATVIRSWQNASPAQLEHLSWPGLVAGLAIHLAMSTGLGLLFAILLPTLPGKPIVWAFAIGPLLWAGAVYAGLPLLNPAMARLVDLPSFAAANIVYSLILGLVIAHTPRISAR